MPQAQPTFGPLDSVPQTVGRKVWRLIKRLCWGLIIVFVLMYSLSTLVARHALVNWLEEQGVDAQFEYLWLSPGAGRIELANFHGASEHGQRFQVGNVTLDLQLLPLLDNRVVVEDLTLEGISMTVRHHNLREWTIAGLNLEALVGQTTPTPTPTDVEPREPWHVSLNRISMTAIELCAENVESSKIVAAHCLEVGQVTLKGGAEVTAGADLAIQWPGTLNVSHVALNDTHNRLTLLELHDIRLAQGHYTPLNMRLGQLGIDQIMLLQRSDRTTKANERSYHTTLQRFDLEQLQYRISSPDVFNETDITLDALTVLGLDVLLHRKKGNVFPALYLIDEVKRQTGMPSVQPQLTESLEVLPTPSSATHEATTDVASDISSATKEAKAPLTINVERFYVGDDSRITVLDEQVSPTVERSFNDFSIELTQISTDVAAAPATLLLSTRVGDFGHLNLNGDVLVSDPTAQLALQGKLTAIDMLPLSPYVESALQQRVDKGALNMDVDAKISKQQLNVAVNLLLDKFYLQSLTKDERAKGEDANSLPIGLALNLLRDRKDRIQLELPITGSVDDPKFSLASVFGIVFRKALTAAVINYYTPFGLVNVGTSLIGAALQLRFDPLVVTAGTAELTPSVKTQLDTLAAMLKEKPQLSLSFCPQMTALDAIAITALPKIPDGGWALTDAQNVALNDLARDRLKAVNTYLQAQGLQATQFIACQADMKLTVSEPPSINVSM